MLHSVAKCCLLSTKYFPVTNNYVPVALLHSRREALLKLLPNSSLCCILSNTAQFRNHDVEYPFRQDSNFWYFTGLDQKDLLLLLYKSSTGIVEEKIYLMPYSAEQAMWGGEQIGASRIQQLSGVQTCEELPTLTKDISGYLTDSQNIYVDLNLYPSHPIVAVLAADLLDKEPLPLRSLVQQLRIYKDAWEIEQMQKAADISIAAHSYALRHLSDAHRYEYHVAADIEHVYSQYNCTWAYPSIVAGGDNACTLHYVANNQRLIAGDLCLIDAGCEYSYYASDITRTYPILGHYSEAQKKVYEIVLAAQAAAIENLQQPDATMASYHQSAVAVLVGGLVDLGVLQGSIVENIEKRSYRPYYGHGTGHFLGLDVHDLGMYKDVHNTATRIQKGMAITVEPGLYFAQDDLTVPAEFRGIGIRIEDDIVKTQSGIVNLTRALPKQVDELEQWMAAMKG